jgi:hypothetical protein
MAMTIPIGKLEYIYKSQSIDYDLYLFIENELYRLTKIEEGIMIPQARSQYTDGDKKLLSMDVKAMNTQYYALSRSKFNRITSYKNVRDI